MLLKEVVPGSFTPPRARLVASRFEDVLDRVPAGWLDSEFFQLAHDPGVAPLVFPGHQ